MATCPTITFPELDDKYPPFAASDSVHHVKLVADKHKHVTSLEYMWLQAPIDLESAKLAPREASGIRKHYIHCHARSTVEVIGLCKSTATQGLVILDCSRLDYTGKQPPALCTVHIHRCGKHLVDEGRHLCPEQVVAMQVSCPPRGVSQHLHPMRISHRLAAKSLQP
jgi:hypothetical protein